jgi:uroporphyrin-III C-methyltransferase
VRGKVYLVGAGPGDPELLTLKAFHLLRTADAVLHDDLIAPEILKLVSTTTQLHNVGKRCGKKNISQNEINFLLIALADSGLQVIRLKSGDPLIFGRAGEEIDALHKAGVDCEIVPGVTSAFGAAATAQIPLTHRRSSSAVVFLTAHQAPDSETANWNKLAGSGATLVIYMPGHNYSEIAAKLKTAGLPSKTPSVIISRATTAQQRTHRTTIADLHRSPHLPAPALLVVGEVVRFADPALLTQEFSSVSSSGGAGLASQITDFSFQIAAIDTNVASADKEPIL